MARSFCDFTSESVCSGHPDKICDQISDAILDQVLSKDKDGRVAVETLVTENRVVLAGEVRSKENINFKKIARDQIKRLGYTDPFLKFTYKSPIDVYIHCQSDEIAVGVEKNGAGDQGMMFGFACEETEDYMPMPISIAHFLVKRIDELRESKELPYLRPDGKSQVTVEYKNGKPRKIKSIVLAVPHFQEIELDQVRTDLYKKIVESIEDNFKIKLNRTDLIVNGTGVWHFSGPAADTGVTGRKIVVDTYGGYARVGGGAFSGKDPSKVDRSGAYAARFIAKNIIAHKLAEKVEVSLAYFIGAKKPVMKEIETFGTEKVSFKVIKSFSDKILDCSVHGIISGLNLKRPIYLKTAAYGHFGRKDFPWEKIANI